MTIKSNFNSQFDSFVNCLCDNAVSSWGYIASKLKADNTEAYGRKRSWPRLSSYPGICLEEVTNSVQSVFVGKLTVTEQLK